MEKFTIGPDAFGRPGGFAFAMDLLRAHKDSLKTVSIKFNNPQQLGLTSTLTIFQRVKELSNLVKLSVGNMDLTGSEIASVFTEVLQQCPWMESLRFSGCLIDQVFVENARVAIRPLASLKILEFHRNQWNESNFKLFMSEVAMPANPMSLTELCLNDCGMTSASLSLLEKLILGHNLLGRINLSGNSVLLKCDSDLYCSFFHSLATLQHLQSLYLHQCGIDNHRALFLFRSIERMPNLARLMMNGNTCILGDLWMQSLPRITGLRTLWLGRELFPLSAAQIHFVGYTLQRNTSLTEIAFNGYPRRLNAIINPVMARNRCIRRAKALARTTINLPIEMLPVLVASHLSLFNGDATAQFIFLRARQEEWICCNSASSKRLSCQR